MYARVVVGTDGSDRSLAARPVGEAAAAAFGCPLELLHVPADEDPTRLDTAGMTVRPASAPAVGLIEHASETHPPGLLCLSTRGRGAVGESVFGSVTAQVIRTLHAPLLIVGPALSTTSQPWRRLLVCLDGSATSASILPVVRQWAGELDLEVHLLHIAYPLGDPRIGDFQVPEETRTATAQLRAATAMLQDAGIAARWSVEDDTQVAAGIVGQATSRTADLIALATHGRTGLARILAGNVALETVRRATIPVLTLRPEDLH